MTTLDAVRAHVKADWANHLYVGGKVSEGASRYDVRIGGGRGVKEKQT